MRSGASVRCPTTAPNTIVRAQEAANFFGSESRREGIRQFIDEKSFKAGPGAHDKSRQRSAKA